MASAMIAIPFEKFKLILDAMLVLANEGPFIRYDEDPINMYKEAVYSLRDSTAKFAVQLSKLLPAPGSTAIPPETIRDMIAEQRKKKESNPDPGAA